MLHGPIAQEYVEQKQQPSSSVSLLLVDSFVRSLIRSFRSFPAAAMEVEGLFRIPGRQTNIFELKVRFEQGMRSVVGSFVRSLIH